MKSVLALGSNTKNTVCFLEKGKAQVSSVHTDLRCRDDFLAFEKDTAAFLKKKPALIAYDLHPEYISTKYALALSEGYPRRLCGVQHHHAHIASCMADNGLKNRKVIGVAFDGTGFGSDGRIWGAEFLICDYAQARRVGHLKEIPLMGLDQATLEPWRLAAAWLGESVLTAAQKRKWDLLRRLYDSGFAYPVASSMGRLFDAAGFLITGRSRVSFEGELALVLEKMAMCDRKAATRYAYRVLRQGAVHVIDPVLMLKQIVTDTQHALPQALIAHRFHLTIAGMVGQMCSVIRTETGIRRVALSGGVFQNNLLLKSVLDLLYKDDFEVFTHQKFSPNDSGISVGQAFIAGFSR
jgi:hydrogenase maturation protein HypF